MAYFNGLKAYNIRIKAVFSFTRGKLFCLQYYSAVLESKTTKTQKSAKKMYNF